MITFRPPLAAAARARLSPDSLPLKLQRLALVACLCCTSLPAAEPPLPKLWEGDDYHVRTWTTDDGLPYNSLNQILQDDRGFIWLATLAGLARYDGHQFKTFELPPEFTPNGYNIRALAQEDAENLILLPTSGEVLRLNDGRFSRHPASDFLIGLRPTDLFVSADGALWIGESGGNLLRWHQGEGRWFELEPPSRLLVRFSFAEGDDGATWIASGRFLGRFHGNELTRINTGLEGDVMIAASQENGIWVCSPTAMHRLVDGKLEAVSTDIPWAGRYPALQHFFEDRAGVLWFGIGRHGLYRWEDAVFTKIDADLSVHFATEDRDGNLWLATVGNGLAQVRLKNHRMLDTRYGLGEPSSSGLHFATDGTLWIANDSGGLARLHDGRAVPLPLSFAGEPLAVNSVVTDAAGDVWTGGRDGLYRLRGDGPAELQKLEVPARYLALLFSSRSGDVWFYGYGGQLGYYHKGRVRTFTAADGYEGQVIRAMVEDPGGRIWLGASTGDLLYLEDGRIHRFEGGPAVRQPIHDLHADDSGALWIATAGGLLYKHGHAMTAFTTANGLSDDLLVRVLEDDRGLLWFASRSGIFFVEKSGLLSVARGESERFISHRFGRDQGLSGATALLNYQPSAGNSADGRLWIATAKGIVSIDPAGLQRHMPAPPVFIDELLVNEVRAPVQSGMTIPPGRHRIEFRFTAPNFGPENVQMHHRLEGADPTWIQTNETHAASYSGLAPGNYRLQVRVRTGMGEWSSLPTSLEFTVLAAWWQTLWLQLGVLVCASAGTAWGVRHWTQRKLKNRLRRLEQEHALELERARIARNLHDELGGSLTEIGLMADRLREAPGSDLPPGLARLASHTRRLHVELASIIWSVSPKNNSLDLLAAFLSRYASRLFRYSNTTCAIEETGRIPARTLSPDVQHHLLAIAKEALNNVLTHAHAEQVVLRTTFTSGIFRLEVEDDGVGFDPESINEDQGNGLSNIRVRSSEIGATLTLDSAPGRGTRLAIAYPCGPMRERRSRARAPQAGEVSCP